MKRLILLFIILSLSLTSYGNIRSTRVYDKDSEIDNLYTASSPVVNVKHPDYGARGDGVTDDAAALQNAFDSGSTVLIPDGTYITNSQLTWTTDDASLIFQSHAAIIKAGSSFPIDTAIIKFDGDSGNKLYRVIVRDLHVDCNSRASGILCEWNDLCQFFSPRIVNGRRYSLEAR